MILLISDKPQRIDLNIEPQPGDEITDKELTNILNKLRSKLEKQFDDYFPRRDK